ncbi:hypothetical protein [Bradyrhizobium sp.]|uniref:hypothetical protein n=1 Tax=Bradyrhizobium sp. TaxID=376 RepID=UPI0025C6826B|nr:hypothetical protein [Bradyrhizobium sp.]
MFKRIDRAIRDYQATTAEVVKAALHAVKDREYTGLINAASIRIGAALTLQDVLAAEIAR